MNDEEIVDMYLARNENAIAETKNKYEKYLHCIAYNILANNEDSDECVNDTYMRAWSSIPPNKPVKLGSYLGTIARNIAVTVFRKQNTASRAGSQYALSLDELAECVSGNDSTETQADSNFIAESIGRYLRKLPVNTRTMFVCRYYFNDSINDIAGYFGATETKVKSALFRARKGLKEHLIKEGIDV